MDHIGTFDKDRIARIATEVSARKKQRRDFAVDRAKMHVAVVDGELVARIDGAGKDGAPEMFSFRRGSLQQMATTLEIPIRYLDRLTDAGHNDIAAANLTRLLEREPKRHLVRTLGTRLDAVLSDRYRSIDNEGVLCVALEETKRAGAQVWDLRISDDEFRFLAVAPHISGKVTTDRTFDGPSRWEGGEGDVHNAAITISNSETGRGSFSAKPSILRRVCQNYCVWADGVARVHLGRKQDQEGEVFFSDETRQLEDRVLMNKVRDTIRATFDPKTFAEKIAQLNEATTRNLPKDKATEVVDATIKAFGLPQERREAILAELLGSHDLTQFGLAQAVTAQVNPTFAGDFDDDTRSLFEDVGGTILALSQGQLATLTK